MAMRTSEFDCDERQLKLSLLFRISIFFCRLPKQSNVKRSNLQFYEMPQITIAPKTKCEISTVVTIDIQPYDTARLEHRNRQQNNLKIVHCVHAAPASGICDDITNNEDGFSPKVPVEEVRSKPTASAVRAVGPSGGSEKQSTATFQLNKYYKPFLSDSTEQRQSIMKALEEDSLHNETSSSLVESVSINLSATSILSDTFAIDSAQRGYITSIRNPVESILNDIFETATQSPVANDHLRGEDTAQKPGAQTTVNALQLRNILDKIRNDKTSLDLAIERRSPMSYVRNGDKLLSPVDTQISQSEEEIKMAAMEVPSPQKSKEDAIDKSVQCDVLDEPVQKTVGTDHTNDRMPKRKSKPRLKVKRDLNEDIMRSPKFTRTLNSIRSSARKLNFDGENGKYKTATPEQIQKAAEKFLNSLINGGNASRPIRRVGDSDSDSMNSYILAPPKYRVIDDKVIQSQYNLLDNTSGLTSDSTIDPILPRKRIVKSSDEMNMSTSSSSIDVRLSNLSLRRVAHNETPQLLALDIGNGDLNGNISDGEVLSEGEIRPDEDE